MTAGVSTVGDDDLMKQSSSAEVTTTVGDDDDLTNDHSVKMQAVVEKLCLTVEERQRLVQENRIVSCGIKKEAVA